MSRIRTIKPGFWKHEELSALPPETHMMAAALLNYADDEGYFNANPKLIKGDCCPLRDDSVNIHGMISDLSNIGYLRIGKGMDGRIYGHVINFLEHQKVNRPYPSKIKDLEIEWGCSLNDHGKHTERSLPEKEKEKEYINKPPYTPPLKKNSRGTRWNEDEVPEFWLAEARNKYPHWSAEFLEDVVGNFCDYWKGVSGAKGVKMDWQATFRNTCRMQNKQFQKPEDPELKNILGIIERKNTA